MWQWCEDWWNKDQKERVLRGASWADCDRGSLLSSHRIRETPTIRHYNSGFRCVLEPAPATALPATPAPQSSSLPTATKAPKSPKILMPQRGLSSAPLQRSRSFMRRNPPASRPPGFPRKIGRHFCDGNDDDTAGDACDAKKQKPASGSAHDTNNTCEAVRQNDH